MVPVYYDLKLKKLQTFPHLRLGPLIVVILKIAVYLSVILYSQVGVDICGMYIFLSMYVVKIKRKSIFKVYPY